MGVELSVYRLHLPRLTMFIDSPVLQSTSLSLLSKITVYRNQEVRVLWVSYKSFMDPLYVELYRNFRENFLYPGSPTVKGLSVHQVTSVGEMKSLITKYSTPTRILYGH